MCLGAALLFGDWPRHERLRQSADVERARAGRGLRPDTVVVMVGARRERERTAGEHGIISCRARLQFFSPTSGAPALASPSLWPPAKQRRPKRAPARDRGGLVSRVRHFLLSGLGKSRAVLPSWPLPSSPPRSPPRSRSRCAAAWLLRGRLTAPACLPPTSPRAATLSLREVPGCAS